ncbi:hypothetical protein TruAng_006697 [Truncatella angustata]|nr:hypothetical protein TruAng_006697 [Truncatella angustata]
MHIINFLTTAVLQAALLRAAPGADLGISVRDGSCPGDQTWCGWTKSCKCDNDYVWDSKKQKCHYPVWPKPVCPTGQKGYCGKSQSEYCEYDLPDKLKDKCPNDHPSCKATQVWDGDSKSCKCPKGKVWRDDKCKHPVMPKPSCSGQQKPCCAKNQKDWCAYDESKKECSNNGKHITFCAAPGKEQQYCDNYWN